MQAREYWWDESYTGEYKQKDSRVKNGPKNINAGDFWEIHYWFGPNLGREDEALHWENPCLL